MTVRMVGSAANIMTAAVAMSLGRVGSEVCIGRWLLLVLFR